MNAKKKRSRKPSAANSGQPHKHTPFFLARNLGKHVIADALRAVGLVVELHDDHLPEDAPDEDWISLAGRNGWIAITKDKNIRYRAFEIGAIKQHSAMIVVIRAKNTTGKDMAEILVKAKSKLQKFAFEHKPPFVIGIYRSGQIRKYKI